MESFFHLKENGTNVKTEIFAGISTFMAMAYILAVNPMILSASGMESPRVFTATALASFIATMIMGLFARLPFALSAGMGMNTLFSYTVCINMGYSWRWALTAVFVEGIIFMVLTFLNIREAIIASIPASLKNAISAGVGLFIAFLGLKNSGVIVAHESDLTALNPDWFKGTSGLALLGILLTAFLLIRKVKGAILLGMLITAVIGIPLGITQYAGGSFLPAAPYFFPFAFGEIVVSGKSMIDFLIIVFTFLFFDMFDTVGCLIACAGKSGIVRADGSIPHAKEALLADSVGTAAGAVLGTSTVTTFVESSVGVAAGGRTGLTSITTAVMFLLALFLQPVFASIPAAATAPALVIVGVMMVGSVREIDFDDYKEAVPAFLTIILMVCASSISDGIMFGILSYVILQLVSGNVRSLKPTIWGITVLFLVRIALTILG